MQLNEKIRTLRIQKEMTQKELGRKVGVSDTSIKCWESGTKNPSMENLILLAQVLCVTTDNLLGISETYLTSNDLHLSKSETKLITNYRKLDVYGQRVVESVCAIEMDRVNSCNVHSQENSNTYSSRLVTLPKKIPKYFTPIAAGYSVPLDDDEYELIDTDMYTPSDADFAVEISGNSMFPYINDGDIVYAKRTTDLEIGDIGIFCVDGAMYCKQFYIDHGGNLTLVSANPELRNSNVELPADCDSSIVCYGKVLLGRKIPLPKYFVGK